MLNAFASNLSFNAAPLPDIAAPSAPAGLTASVSLRNSGAGRSGSGGFAETLSGLVDGSGNKDAEASSENGRQSKTASSSSASVSGGFFSAPAGSNNDGSNIANAPSASSSASVSGGSSAGGADITRKGVQSGQNTPDNKTPDKAASGSPGRISYFIGNTNVAVQLVSADGGNINSSKNNAASGNSGNAPDGAASSAPDGSNNANAPSASSSAPVSGGSSKGGADIGQTGVQSGQNTPDNKTPDKAASGSAGLNSKPEDAVRNAGNQNYRNAAQENKQKPAVPENAGPLPKDAAAAGILNLTGINGEAKQVISGAAGGASAGGASGNAFNNGSAAPAELKIGGFIDAGSVQGGGASFNNGASGGNSPGFDLSAGAAQGTGSAGDTSASGSIAVNSVMFMLNKNVQSAVLTLTPPSLGSVKISIALNNPSSGLNSLNSAASNGGGSITINMLAQNDAAKNILQSSSGSLQNALKNQGYSSINLNISSGSSYNSQTGNNGNENFKNPFIDNSYNGGSFANKASGTDAFSSASAAAYRNPDSLVDYFV